MPVVTNSKSPRHVNPMFNGGEVYKIIRGYGAGRVFVITSNHEPFIQYLAGSGDSGWDNTTALESSDFVVVTLQEL